MFWEKQAKSSKEPNGDGEDAADIEPKRPPLQLNEATGEYELPVRKKHADFVKIMKNKLPNCFVYVDEK
jgi:hypothetical protein